MQNRVRGALTTIIVKGRHHNSSNYGFEGRWISMARVAFSTRDLSFNYIPLKVQVAFPDINIHWQV